MQSIPSPLPGVAELTAAVDPVVRAAGLIVEAVETPGGTPPVVRVVVDREEGPEGPSLDAVAELSEALGEVLDAGVLSGPEPYDLEVTTPGASRPLTLPRHWRRNVSRMVVVKTLEGEELRGLLLAADEDGIEMEPIRPAPKKGMKDKVLPAQRLAYAQLRKGKVDVEATAARVLAAAGAGELNNTQLDIEEA